MSHAQRNYSRSVFTFEFSALSSNFYLVILSLYSSSARNKTYYPLLHVDSDDDDDDEHDFFYQ